MLMQFNSSKSNPFGTCKCYAFLRLWKVIHWSIQLINSKCLCNLIPVKVIPLVYVSVTHFFVDQKLYPESSKPLFYHLCEYDTTQVKFN